MLWQPRADHEQKQELGDATITQGLDATRPIPEALLWHFSLKQLENQVLSPTGSIRLNV
jgi:hypothetical protein